MFTPTSRLAIQAPEHLVQGSLPLRLVKAGRAAAAETPDPQASRAPVLAELKTVLAAGRAEIARRFQAGDAGPLRGLTAAAETSYLLDRIIAAAFAWAHEVAYPAANPTPGERVALVALGGYGRGELAPFSDIDLLVLLPQRKAARAEAVAESVLYLLWDLGLKVGHAVRTVEDTVRAAKEDLSTLTSLVEARPLAGEPALFAELEQRIATHLTDQKLAFVEKKLAERAERHRKQGGSRYMVEPNVKDGKGGLRDLQTLLWLGRAVYQAGTLETLVEDQVLAVDEAQTFAKAHAFLWTVRVQLHLLAGRPEERLTFDWQKPMAEAFGYTDHTTLGVERFMKHYFLTAKDVGDLTRIVCAAIEAAARQRRTAGGTTPKPFHGFALDHERLTLLHPLQLSREPLDIMRLFAVAQREGRDIHPQALRAVKRTRAKIRMLRQNPEANHLFLDMLTGPQPEMTLRRLSEAGVLGAFLPEFQHIVAMMQFDMYHHYTVDEHTLRAIGLLSQLEAGQLAADLPLATQLMRQVGAARRLLYGALFFHDMAKGRGGDHSILGATMAERLAPRIGFDEAETETIAWLVRWHLAMSEAAFRRDLEDERTLRDFTQLVESPNRLQLLTILTSLDISAVGPGRWTGWRASLLSALYAKAEERLSGGHASTQAGARLEAARQALRPALPELDDAAFEALAALLPSPWWLTIDPAAQAMQVRLLARAQQANKRLAIDFRQPCDNCATEFLVYAPDHHGLFARIAGGLAAAGANIVDARIFTLSNGMALDQFTIQDVTGAPFEDSERRERLATTVERVLTGLQDPGATLRDRRVPPGPRLEAMRTPPRVSIDNAASGTFTVIEVNGRDRPGLLYELTRAIADEGLQIGSAKVSTYGNKAIDVFYLKDVFGLKIQDRRRLERLSRALERAIS